MSLHARRLIVRAAVLRLAGVTTATGGVHEGRAAPKASSAAPYLLVYARPEDSEPLSGTGAGRKLRRELTLAIEAVTAEAGPEAGDALLDQLALEIERVLAAEPTLGGACRDLYLARTDPDGRAEGESRIGRTRLEFRVLYQTLAAAPDQAV